MKARLITLSVTLVVLAASFAAIEQAPPEGGANASRSTTEAALAERSTRVSDGPPMAGRLAVIGKRV